MKRIIRLFLKNPCEKCLVKSICNKGSDSCEPYRDYCQKKERTEDIILSMFIYVIIFFLLSTFILGLYKWYEILFK